MDSGIREKIKISIRKTMRPWKRSLYRPIGSTQLIGKFVIGKPKNKMMLNPFCLLNLSLEKESEASDGFRGKAGADRFYRFQAGC